MKYPGLNDVEVSKAIERGEVNHVKRVFGKTNWQIISFHVFTLFNLYHVIIAMFLLYAEAYSSLFFVFIIISNTMIYITQEIKSTRLVEKLSLLVSTKTQVVRNSELISIENSEIVLNDIVYFNAGNQISADAILLDDFVEMDESLLTGESDPIIKVKGDMLLSGTFVMSGSCFGQVCHVGEDCYIEKIIKEAQNTKPVQSELMNTFNRITKYATLLVLPIMIILAYQGLIIRQQPIKEVIIYTATALLGMLPKGLVLLTSLSLATSIFKLGNRKIFVKNLYSIEALSRVDTFCIDKTGTLTEGLMNVEEIITYSQDYGSVHSIMRNYLANSSGSNSTSEALARHFGYKSNVSSTNQIPFSSIRKWGAVELESFGTIIIGAPEMILPNFVLDEESLIRQQEGARILLVAYHEHFESLPDDLYSSTPIASIIISDQLRLETKTAIEYLNQNDVTVKVISGDNPATVSAIAKMASVQNADLYIDASTLVSDEDLENAILNYAIIGRATPYQKHKMVIALQKNQHQVAMIGDGVNDILALKEADVSIAMGTGSDAAKQVSNVVIGNGELSSVPDMIKEGRLVINNVTRSASMYYLKTMYTIGLALFSIILNTSFPFTPFQIALMDMFISGFPSFMLTFEYLYPRMEETVEFHTLKHAVPNAIMIVITVTALSLLTHFFDLNPQQMTTILYFVVSAISLEMIVSIYSPMTTYRRWIVVIDIVAFIITIPIFSVLLNLSLFSFAMIQILIATLMISFVLIKMIRMIIVRYLSKQKLKVA